MTPPWKMNPDFLDLVIFSISVREHVLCFIVCHWFGEKLRQMEITERKWINSKPVSAKRQYFPKCGLKTSYFRNTCLFSMQIPRSHLMVHMRPLDLIEPPVLCRTVSAVSIPTAALPLVSSNQQWQAWQPGLPSPQAPGWSPCTLSGSRPHVYQVSEDNSTHLLSRVNWLFWWTFSLPSNLFCGGLLSQFGLMLCQMREWQIVLAQLGPLFSSSCRLLSICPTGISMQKVALQLTLNSTVSESENRSVMSNSLGPHGL